MGCCGAYVKPPESTGASWLASISHRSSLACAKAGIKLPFLPGQFAQGLWPGFDQPARQPGEISLRRPFTQTAGNARQQHLLDGLAVEQMDQLRRLCERSHRPAGGRALF
jgi:hypothetical protein